MAIAAYRLGLATRLMPFAGIAGVVIATVLTVWPEYQRLAPYLGNAPLFDVVRARTMGVTATQDSTSEWREVRAQVTFPWPVRNRATFLRRNLPQALSLPDRPRDQPPPQRSKLYRDDEPIASLTAPMQNSRPCRSRSSPAAAKRCAAGAGLDGDPLGRGTIGCAVR